MTRNHPLKGVRRTLPENERFSPANTGPVSCSAWALNGIPSFSACVTSFELDACRMQFHYSSSLLRVRPAFTKERPPSEDGTSSLSPVNLSRCITCTNYLLLLRISASTCLSVYIILFCLQLFILIFCHF